MANMLRFSYQPYGSADLFTKSLSSASADPFAPIGALVGGSEGFVIVSRLPLEQFKAIAAAVASITGAKQADMTNIETGEGF